MTSNLPATLSFESHVLNVVHRDGRDGFISSELAKALGYAEESSITNLYNRHRAEFRDDMSWITNLMIQGQERQTRLFSLRGAYLVSMKATTPTAKRFRVWALDVLEGLQQVQPVTNSHELEELGILASHLGTLASQIAAMEEKLSQALTYRTGEAKGGTKDVATSKQAGRIISMLEKLTESKTITLTPTQEIVALDDPLNRTPLQYANDALFCMVIEADPLKRKRLAAEIMRQLLILRDGSEALARQQDLLNQLIEAVKGSALAQENRELREANARLLSKIHGFESAMGRMLKIQSDLKQPELAA